MKRLAALLICIGLVACGDAPPRLRSAEAGTEFTLAPGETASLISVAHTVQFVGVSEDSRCPRDTTCIWAGEVKAQLRVRGTQAGPVEREMLEGSSTPAGNSRLTLLRVEPYPTSTTVIPARDYRVILKLDPVR